MEKKSEVRTFLIEFECPNCRAGHLKATGTVLNTYPAQFPHQCDCCEHTQTFDKTYPVLEYEKIH